MSKIQGKQIADQTLLQRNLALETPLSGDTLSGATVEYVNSYITSLSGATVIGEAEDGTYEDGIFTDFTPDTRIGVAIDRFNEMFLLLAPSPPQSWEGALTSVTVSGTKYSPRELGSTSTVSNMITLTTPTPSVSGNVGTGANARIMDAVLTLSNDGSQLETVTIDGDSVTKDTGRIRYTIADPYDGVSGQAGFWIGVTSLTLATAVPAITPSPDIVTLSLTYPSSNSPLTFDYYVDDPITPSVGTVSATMPASMAGNVSGVPTLTTAQSVTSISFTVSDAVSHFWAPSPFYNISGGLIVNKSGNPTSPPSTNGQTVDITGESVNIANNAFSDTSFSFGVTARNSISVSSTSSSYSNSAFRVDTTSNETGRLTSGEGQYPTTGWGGTYDSSVSLLTAGNYSNELQLRNGIYVYPTVNYTTQGGPDYSSATGTRYVTFNIGSFSDNSAFTLNITGSGINSIGQADLRIEVQISGQTFWVDGNAEYPGVGDPGSSANGDPAVVVGFPSTAETRRITFGSETYTGAIIVRIGMTAGSNITITSLTATAIV